MSRMVSDRTSQKSALLAGLLSAIVPGAGQWYAGKQRRALLLLAPLVALIIAALVVRATTTNVDLLVTFVQPKNLWALLAGNFVLVGWRLWAVVDAYRIVSGGRPPSVLVWVGLGAMLVGVGAPHVVAGSYGWRSINVLNTVFVDDNPTATPTTTSTLPDPESDIVPDPTTVEDLDDHPVTVERLITDVVTVEYRTVGLIFRDGVGDPDAISVRRELRAGPPAGAPFVDFAQRVDEDRITILLAGGDAGPGRPGLRTDTMIVATVNVVTGHAALFGLPRNLKRVPLPKRIEHAFDDLALATWEWEPDEDEDGFPDDWVDLDGDEIPDMPELDCHCFPDLLNALHARTQTWTASYPDSPDPGMDALADTIGNMIGLPIDYWLLVDMRGFVRLIDAMGGVDVMVTDALHVGVSESEEGLPKAVVNVEPGMNHLTGSEALAYVRWRRGSSDYVRMRRQRCLLRSVAAEADPVTMLRSFTSIADVIESSVVTNIPLSFLPDLVEVVGRVNLSEVATIGLVPTTYTGPRTPGRYPTPNVDRMRAKVAEVLEQGAAVQSTTGESECGI